MKKVKRKLLKVIRDGIRKGFSHKKIAISITLGVVIGIIPVYGLTTLMVSVLALSLRLNMVVMQVVHYILHPVQILLFIPFFKLGDMLLKDSNVDFSLAEYMHLFKTDFWGALSEIWKLNLSALAIWVLISIPLYIFMYRLSVYMIRRYVPVIAK